MNVNHDNPTPPGPKKPLRFIRALLVVVTAFCILFVLVGVVMPPPDWNKMLQDATQPADRVVVEPIGNWLRPPPNSVEIKDQKKVQELVAAITMDQPQSWDVCACKGDTLRPSRRVGLDYE